MLKTEIEENNFLFLEVGNSLPLSIVKKLATECEIKNIYGTVSDRSIDISIFSEPPLYVWDLFDGKYPSVLPIDREYENPISEYTVEILHQMARHGNLNFEKRTCLYYTHLKYWDDFLEKKKINYVVFSMLPHETYNFIIYLLCKKKKIKTCMSYIDGYKLSITPKAYYMLNFLEEHTIEVKEKYEDLRMRYQDKNENEINIPDCMEDIVKKIIARFDKAETTHMTLMNEMRLKDIKRYYSDPQGTFQRVRQGQDSLRSLAGSYRQYLRGRYRTKKLIKKYEGVATQPDYSDKYVFYALHYQPECTSSPLGGGFSNQLLAIQLIAYNLPEGYWLYVKEHPVQSAFGREPSYYEELIIIPKVKVISQKNTSEKLMKHAMAVATLTGTVIYESQLIQKPCLCLGYSPLELLDGVYRINTNEECQRAITEIIAGKAKVTQAKDFKLFLQAMEETCFAKADEDEYYQKILKFVNT